MWACLACKQGAAGPRTPFALQAVRRLVTLHKQHHPPAASPQPVTIHVKAQAWQQQHVQQAILQQRCTRTGVPRAVFMSSKQLNCPRQGWPCSPILWGSAPCLSTQEAHQRSGAHHLLEAGRLHKWAAAPEFQREAQAPATPSHLSWGGGGGHERIWQLS